jgi:integrase
MVTGSLQIKGDKYYAVVRIPDETGKEKQKWISTGISATGNKKRQANARLREILVDLEQKKITYSADILFLDWIDIWMAQKQNEVRQNSLEGYQFYISKHIAPFYEPLKLTLQSITPQNIQDYYNAKRKAGQSASSIQKHNVVIRGALQEAVKKNLIPYNPADRATLPTLERFVGKAYTLEQANTLLSVTDNDPLKPAIILGLFYGLRRSEILGLRWRDIDFKANTIRICNTVVKTKTIIEAERTKSKASKRTLHIIPETKEYLMSLQRRQTENRLLIGSSYNVNDHVCVWDDGKPFIPDYISQRFAKILKKHDLPHIRFHELRHTAGSLLLERGLTAKQIQEYLGHERVATTLDIYGHLSVEGKKEAANTMGKLLAFGMAQ